MDPNWRRSYRKVATILSQTVRASAVECMNSILQMHQSRHRTLTQGLLDLKRLYWNTREFRLAQRNGCCSYEYIVKLGSYDFWGLRQDELGAAQCRGQGKRQTQGQNAGCRRLT